MQIDITNITKKDGIYTVDFWDEAAETVTNVSMQISEGRLYKFIQDSGMNREEFVDSDWDMRTIPPYQYLEGNERQVIKEYLEANL